MTGDQIREVVVRRVRLREELKPIKAYWHSGLVQPDWLFLTHVAGPGGRESFELQSVKVWPAAREPEAARAILTGNISYETLRIAKAQAHADVGVEYVEWEPCYVEISNADGSIEWVRGVPRTEPAALG